MTIQKKSLISKLNTTKKAIVASTPATAVSSSEVRTNMARRANRNVFRATPSRLSERRYSGRK